MKKKLQFILSTILFLSALSFSSIDLKAQTQDTTLFDYDNYKFCKACGDDITYGTETKDSLTDSIPSGYYYSNMQVKLKLFACYSGIMDLYLNGKVVSSKSSTYNCSCNACDSILFTISATDISTYYKLGQKNYFSIKLRGSGTIYFDRSIIYRTRVLKMNYDAAILSVDSPGVYACKGAHNIVVKIQNNGKKKFTGLDVDWTWNGASQTTATYSGTLDTLNGTGNNKALLSIGSKSFSLGKKDTLMAWSKNPGGVHDSINFNDTIRFVFNGSYGDTITVGGSSPTFSTIQGAINALMTYGVCAPTFVKIRPGTYNEQLSIGHIPGSNVTNLVTFLSSNNDSSSVFINYSANSSNNYTVKLSNTGFVKFHKLTFEALNSTYGTVFLILNSIENLTISHSQLNGINTSSTSTNQSVLYRYYNNYNDITKNVQLLNSSILYGSFGAYFSNAYGNYAEGTVIKNCVFENQYYGNLLFQYSRNATIQNNKFERNGSTPYYGFGIQYYYSNDSLNISYNKIRQNSGGYGIYLYGANGTSTKRNLIGNNEISINSSYYGYNALVNYSSNYVDIVSNSIYNNIPSNTGTVCFYSSGGSNNRLLYNNFYNANAGYVFEIYSSSNNDISQSDRNNFYNNGKSLGRLYNNGIGSINDLKAFGLDSNSVSVNPNFTSATDLHAYSVDLDGRAKPYKGLEKDMDNQLRSSTTPDVGADEFRLLSLDAGITDVKQTLSGSQCLKVVIKNFGSTTLTSAKIDWTVNGVAKTQYSWTGSLTKGDTDIVCLGTINFKMDTLYKLKTWSSGPNSGNDSLHSNDTLTTEFYPAMNGIYTIGGTSPDFTTFDKAVIAIEKAGVLDSVYFKVRDGNYTEQIQIDKLNGPNKRNAIVFESENKDKSKVTLQYGSSGYYNNYVVDINGANGVTFKNITLFNAGTSSYLGVVTVQNASSFVHFENCTFTNLDSTSSNYYRALVRTEYNQGTSIEFINNLFLRGSYGIYHYGDYNTNDKKVKYANNTFLKQGYAPVQIYNIDHLEFSNNQITNTNSNIYIGVEIGDFSGPSAIFNNKVMVGGNNLDYGMYINDYYSSKDTLQIYNNFISINGNQRGIGLYCNYLRTANVSYNNVLNECTDSSYNSSALYISSGDYKFRNNNFIHNKNGYAIYNNYFYSIESDFNNLYSNGTKLIYWDGNTYNNLSDYQSNEGFDSNSVHADPLYISTNDLHTSSTAINGKGIPVNGISKDIDGETRNSTKPDIGADEFTPLTLDVGVTKIASPGVGFKADTLDLDLVVFNFGIDTIKKVTLQMKINKDTIARKTISRNIASGDTIHVKIGTYIFKQDSIYDLLAWTSLPNGGTDQKKSNDTTKLLKVSPAMTGIYTIGGSSPNFPTFKAAIDALKLLGMIDSVVFKVRQGTYTEQLNIPAISGAYKRHSIVFESEDKDTGKVTLKFASTKYDTNYVVFFNGCDGITFRQMKLISNSTSGYNVVFLIKNRADNNTIELNAIEGPNTSGSSSYNALIYSPQDADNNLFIKNNVIRNGDYSIYFSGYPSSSPYNAYENGLEITGNYFNNPYYSGIYCYYFDTVIISRNSIYMDKYVYSIAIRGDQLKRFEITNNSIVSPNGYYGYYLYSCGQSSSSHRSLFSNNTLNSKSTNSNNYGIYLYDNYYTDFIHNTIKLENTVSVGYPMYAYYGYNNNFYNNILYNNSTGYACFLYSSPFDNMNYNDLYTKGSTLVYNSGTNYSNLSSWQTGTSFDLNSVSIDPLFKSPSNLHVKEVALNGAALYFKQVPMDMDYETRDTLKPDIGADEFTLPPNDAGIFKIILPQKPFPVDTQFVKVVLKNYGGNPLYIVDLNWDFNGVSQTKISWADTLLAGDTMHVKLGKKFFSKDSSYSLKVWTSQPNGTGDSINYNDTMGIKNQYPALSGVYTIGGASPNFSTFNDAVTAMKRGGIIDSVRFDVRSGTYYEQIIIPYIIGAKKENSIIFQSEQKDSSKVILIGSTSYADNYTVRLDSAFGVTFRYMGIMTTQPNYYNRVFDMIGHCKKINIHHCNLKGKYTGNGDQEAIIYIHSINSNHPSYDEINIFNNRFSMGTYGIYSYGYSSIYGRNLNVYENNFEDQYNYGLYLLYSNNFSIKKNAIYHTTNLNSSGYGIAAHYCSDGYEITGNNIYNQEYVALYLYQCVGAYQDTALVANNFFHVQTNNSVYGSLIYYPSYLNYLNNNSHVTSSSSSSYGALFYSPQRTFVYNNNFIHSGNGLAIYLQGSFSKSNFNNFFSNGTLLAYGNNNYSTLSNWQSGTGQDAKSINVDPEYVSSSDLHVRAVDLDGKGRNHKYLITLDIDNQKRDSLTPDIGADEFDIPSANDAGILSYYGPVSPFNPGNNKVVVSIKNHGSDSLKSATIKWRVNGTLQASKNWTGKLKSGQSDTVTIGTFNFGSGKKHDLLFWTTIPNGVADTTNYNDTLLKVNIYPGLKGVYTVSGTLPDYNNLMEAFTALKAGGIIDTVWFKIRTGTYGYNLTVDNYLGASAKRPVYIESQSGDSSDVVLNNSSYGNQIININGADHLRFRKLTFSPTYSYAIRVENDAVGIQFENCQFNLNNSYYYYYGYSYGITSFSGMDDSLWVRNCRFDNGAYGIYTYGYASNGNYERGINIEKNVFNHQIYSAIYMQYANSPKITSNLINSNNGNNPAINAYYTTNNLNVSYNKISQTGSYGEGISVYYHNGNSGSRGNIFNNFVSIDGSSNYQEGLKIYNGNYLNIYHNSINVYGSNSNSYPMLIQSGSNYDVRNNIFSNLGGGLAINYSGSPTFSQANYNDIYSSGSVLGIFNGANQSNLTAWKSAFGKDANSISFDPSYNSNTDLHVNLSNLDSACIPISSVTDDIDRETRNTSKADIGADEFQSLPDNLGVSAFVKPINSCGLDSSIIKVKIFNYGNKQQFNFPLKYVLNGGTLISATISDTLKPGKEMEYVFKKKEALSFNTVHKIMSWTDLSNEKFRANDTSKLSFTNYSIPDTVKSMVPTNQTTGIDFPFTLSWLPASGATKYDLFLWKSTDSKPSSANVSNLTQISYQISSGLAYGEKYNWQIVARNAVCSTPGLQKSFTMKYLPDLIVSEVNAPNSAFSANNISVSWKVKNNGQGTASGTWYDAVYLSNDAILDVTDKYLGAINNPSGLNASQNYSQSMSVTLPNGISGNYYIFVATDVYNYVVETDNNNNSTKDTGKMVVTLTSPPDLVVTSVTRPSTAFSGSSANLTFIIKNDGTGKTRSGGWYDRVFLSTEKVINSGSYNLKSIYHSGDLDVDSTYSVSTSVTIPNFISGKYFFVVETDYAKHEYEHASEGNNTKGSDTIKVILTPPPDLIVRNLQTEDTVSNSQSVLIKYDVINDGGTTTGGGFYDVLFLCQTSTFNSSIAHYIGTRLNGSAIDTKDTSKVSQKFTIPQTLTGPYYLFVLTDYYNHINEVSKETNNTSTGFKIIINNPELIITRTQVSSTDSTGSPTPINWTVKNQGTGADYQGNRNDSIYMSKFSKWNRSQATPLGRLRYSKNILPGDTVPRSTIVTIPDGFDGNWYFFANSDASNEVFENGKDTNNYKRSNLMNIVLSPYPDLFPTFTAFPDSAKGGEVIGLSYMVKNKGTNKARPTWKDRFYFSKDSVFNPTKVFTLGTITRSAVLEKDSSYSATVYFALPSSVAKGNYYYFIFNDAEKDVYEHFNDSNNIIRTKKIFIDGYPPVDLKVNCPAIIDTMASGNSYTLTYSVTNIGEAKTAISAWNDGVYLSADSILNSGDMFITNIPVNKALEKDSTYKVSKSIMIPNGVQGNFYLIVKTDIGKLITDIDTNNNKRAVCKSTGGSKLLRINLTPPSDLQITSWNIPATSTSGQPIKIKWKVENKGSGATRSGGWNDQFFLSTDYIIDGGDYYLGESNHVGNLAVNASYNDSQDFTIPLNKVGNFIVIIRTDGSNFEYEHSNEGNNIVSSSTTASKAPPADLIVSSVTAPDSVISGRNITVNWKVKNTGSNPASGYMKDNVYLSTDDRQDANDLLLVTDYYSISLAPNAETSRSKKVNVGGVPLGDYYVLVATDVLNNINESNDTNNTSTATNLLNVNVPLLPLAIVTPDTLTDGEKIYHRIIIPDSLLGQSMLIILKADSVNGDNQIFVRYNEVASGSEFDFKYREPFKGNQEIIIPELKTGTYYLLTTGKTKAGTRQNITLLARIMPFEIRKITPAVGGNTGEVTTLIEGSKFEPDVQFLLLKNGAVFAGLPDTLGLRYQFSNSGSIGSSLIDPTLAFATFNLIGLDTGKYDVLALKGLESAILIKGFKVIEGVAGDLNVEIISPGNTRANTILSMDVLFTNSGNTDLVNKKLIISSIAGAPIAFTQEDLSKNYSSLEIKVQEENGPPNRLRPDGNGSVKIYMKSSGALDFTILNN